MSLPVVISQTLDDVLFLFEPCDCQLVKPINNLIVASAFIVSSTVTILLHFFINWLFMLFLKMDSRFHGNDKKWYFAPICVIPA